MSTLGNEPLGIVEEARRRREQYKRYIDERVAATVDSEPIQSQIEQLVDERVTAAIRRLVGLRAAALFKDLEELVVFSGPKARDILDAVAAASGFTVEQ